MKTVSILLAVVILLAQAPNAQATFHLMQVEQIIGGVDGDATKQAIQLQMRSSFQNQVQNSRLVVWDAAGANPIVVATPGSSVANHGAGVKVLVASAGFAGATNPTAVPDFAMSNLIPASYLAAGSLTFESSTGTIVYWRVSWGGGAYTGSTTGAITNDADGQFGPAFGGALPSAGTDALLFQGTSTALSTNNAADYALTSGDAVFTNNAGNTFTVESTASGVEDTPGPRLSQNYPNPFNPTTHISFTTGAPTHATLTVFDASGSVVVNLLDEPVVAGTIRTKWDGVDASGRRVPSGVYFYRLVTGTGQVSRKMLLLK